MIFMIAFSLFLIMAFLGGGECKSEYTQRYNKYGTAKETAAFHNCGGGPYYTKKQWEYINGYESVEKVIEKYRSKNK